MKTANVFGNHMVLQRDIELPVWGEAAPGTRVVVRIQGQEASTAADAKGKWKLSIGPLRVSRDETMTVEGEDETLCFSRVAVGEVWLAGGQSNMEFHMRYDKQFKEAVADCANPDIRFFDCPKLSYEGEEYDFDYSSFGFWRPCNAENLQWYSAVGYYFAQKLHAELDIPVGILGCNLGGSRAVCWMDEDTAKECAQVWLEEYAEGLKKIPDLNAYFAQYKSDPVNDHSHPFDNPIADRMLYGVTLEEMQEILSSLFGENKSPVFAFQIGPCHDWRPHGLYYTMLKKIAPYGIRGVIWYQGESDAFHADAYASVLSGMIGCWRRLWGFELPFLMAQLAPLAELADPSAAGYPAICRAQQTVSETLPGVWCSATGDVGSFHDIHPKEKRPVGQRLALLALNHIYGESGLLCEAPLAQDCSLENGELVLRFRYGQGLYRSSDAPLPLKVSIEGQSLEEARGLDVALKDNTLRIRSESLDLSRWETVSMGADPWYVMNLCNAADIPAKPFLLRRNSHEPR